jgi:hypothetical protein
MSRVGLVSVRRVERLNFGFAPWSWHFADRRRQKIDAFFSANPKQILLSGMAGCCYRAMSSRRANAVWDFFETDASLLAALAWKAMGPTVKACFPGAAIFGSGGGLVLAEMAPHTRNAGQLLSFRFGRNYRRGQRAGRVRSPGGDGYRPGKCSRPKTAGTRSAPVSQ